MNREHIYAALFERLKAIPGLRTTSRRLKQWGDVDSSQQPALFLAQGRETATPGDPARGVPTKWLLHPEVYLYVRTTGNQAPGTVMNPLLDAIEAVTKPDNPMQRVQTLGGLVERCWIEGDIETDEGTLGDQAVAIVPFRILAT
ncbi:hypothetical protein HA052_11010 [Chromobacterium haemolyticum]|uniref:DUF3168 domain-containing protein n=1 Tax=Chromobacterium fluminis TaxID=3044269 RepID=A0ABX0L8B5_9NEIS|nr:hypothetical protein [Chromobacterium haemolyticum]NHR05729.1 hypothetical protein [Chromobacterium haemolyticum]